MIEKWTGNPNEENALEWWNALPLEEQHDEVYHYCTGHEMSPQEFSVDNIISIWERKINK